MLELTTTERERVYHSATHHKELKEMVAHANKITFYAYTIDGKTLAYGKARFDHAEGKTIRPFHFAANGSVIWSEPKMAQKPLYGLPLDGDTVYFVEGEKCADALRELGLTATTGGGATTLKTVDFSPLQGKHCLIWRDNDKAGEQWQRQLQSAFQEHGISFEGLVIEAIALPDGGQLPDKGDGADFVEAYRAVGEPLKAIKARVSSLPTETPAAKPMDNPSPLPEHDNSFQAILLQIPSNKANFEAFCEQFAKLDTFDIEQKRKMVVKHFDVSPAFLQQTLADIQTRAQFVAPKPYPEPVDGRALFDELYSLVDDYMVIDEPLKVAFALWVVMTYLTDCAQYLPLAWITAPERACGKSTLLSLFERLVHKPITANSITTAATFRLIDKHHPTLLVDEIDTFLKENKELLGIVNAGYSRHASLVYRYDIDEKCERSFDVFTPKVFSGIGEMGETFVSRAIRFELRRKTNEDKAIKRLNQQTLPYQQTEVLRQKIQRWCQDNKQKVEAAAEAVQPIEINDRVFDNWFILFQVAIVFGVYDKALSACQMLNQQQEAKLSIGEQLLWDIRELIREDKTTHYPSDIYLNSKTLHEALINQPHYLWGTYQKGQPISMHMFAKHLKGYGIKSERKGDKKLSCYHINDLHAAFARYLPPVPS